MIILKGEKLNKNVGLIIKLQKGKLDSFISWSPKEIKARK